MMHRYILFIALACLIAPTFAIAQDAPPTAGVTYHKCTRVGQLAQVVDSLVTPIAQELVSEGKLMSFGMLAHDWGDEWNVVFYYTAENKAAFFEAWAEMGRRYIGRHPDAPLLSDFCTGEHKDNIYTLRTVTTEATQ